MGGISLIFSMKRFRNSDLLQRIVSFLKDGLLTLLLHALHSIAKGVLFCVRNKIFIADLLETLLWVPLVLSYPVLTIIGFMILSDSYPWIINLFLGLALPYISIKIIRYLWRF
jgi:hypothetical protein